MKYPIATPYIKKFFLYSEVKEIKLNILIVMK